MNYSRNKEDTIEFAIQTLTIDVGCWVYASASTITSTR